jgi:hypothetical protein
MPGSPTTPGRAGTRADAPAHVAFRHENSVGTRDSSSFAAQWLAYAHPYRRFTAALAGDGARLGAGVDRYSFTVVDLHHLLPAGLPAHSHRTVERRTLGVPFVTLTAPCGYIVQPTIGAPACRRQSVQ